MLGKVSDRRLSVTNPINIALEEAELLTPNDQEDVSEMEIPRKNEVAALQKPVRQAHAAQEPEGKTTSTTLLQQSPILWTYRHSNIYRYTRTHTPTHTYIPIYAPSA